jgi:quercetin dioxygenase-like cupin family protein
MNGDAELDLDRIARDSLHFRRCVIELAPDAELRADTWRDAIVFLASGEVELECDAGECRRFAAGAVLCFPPPVRVVRNGGCEPARLIAISRRILTG